MQPFSVLVNGNPNATTIWKTAWQFLIRPGTFLFNATVTTYGIYPTYFNTSFHKNLAMNVLQPWMVMLAFIYQITGISAKVVLKKEHKCGKVRGWECILLGKAKHSGKNAHYTILTPWKSQKGICLETGYGHAHNPRHLEQ